MATVYTISLRARAAWIDYFGSRSDNLAAAGICRAAAARCREIASQIEHLEERVAALEGTAPR
jgi:hypothetical protein